LTLLGLAKKKFAARNLTAAEETLFRAAESGEEASALTGDDKQDDPSAAGKWPESRVIEAECLVWLCTNREASAIVTYRGIQIVGMRIDGNLDLENAQITFPFLTTNCAFTGSILLRTARMRSLCLLNCSVKALNGNGAHIEGNVFLRGGFKAEGEVKFTAATIGGDLDFDGAQLTNPQGYALIADGANINGSVTLRQTKAVGQVSVAGAVISRNLSCIGAQLSNPKPSGCALNADGAKINGSVFLRYGFKAVGEVNFVSATIGSNLDCSGALLTTPHRTVLSADGVKIEGGVFLRNAFTFGALSLVGAAIGGDLECDGAHLTNPNGTALSAEGVKIKGNVFLRKPPKAEGQRQAFIADGLVDFIGGDIGGYFVWQGVMPTENTTLDLRSAKVGTLWDDEKSWPRAGKLFLDGFAYNRIYDDAPIDAKNRIQWLQLQPRAHFLPQPYEELASVLRSMGYEAEAREVLIEKNRDHMTFTRRLRLRHEWWWYNVFGRLIGYGYKPLRAFVISFGVIVLGYILFQLGYMCDLISPTSENGYAKDQAGQVVLSNGRHTFSENYPKFNAFVYSLESFTPLLRLDQSANWTPNANRGPRVHYWQLDFPTTGSMLRTYLWFHIISGWVLTSLWAGAITGLLKR
jgi:hypothetical protein